MSDKIELTEAQAKALMKLKARAQDLRDNIAPTDLGNLYDALQACKEAGL